MIEILQKMLDLLTSAYNKRPDGMIGKLFSIFAEAIAGVMNTLTIIGAWRNIDQASGTTLDRIGNNFGVARGNASDNFYRLMIKVKITAMLSGGDIDTVITAVAVLLNIEPSDVELVENYPAKVWLYINEDVVDPEYIEYAPLTASIIFRLIAAGIGKRIFLRYRHQADIGVRMATGTAKADQLTITPTPARATGASALYVASAACEISHYTIKPKEE
jgi:hypothetical protein